MEQIFLIALRRNHCYQYLDLGFLVSRTVNKFLLFKLLSSWDFIMVALKTNALEFLEIEPEMKFLGKRSIEGLSF